MEAELIHASAATEGRAQRSESSLSRTASGVTSA